MHRPERGSDVEAWIKAKRNRFMQLEDVEWFAIDDMLDEYRLRADTGTNLLEPLES